jgi:hypothetical protein
VSVEDLLSAAGLDHDFGLLVQDVMRVMMQQELFTFVTALPVQQPNGTTKAVSRTNNEAERTCVARRKRGPPATPTRPTKAPGGKPC